MSWDKLPPIDSDKICIGCLTCSTAAAIAPLNMHISVGFGQAYVTKDGQQIYDGEADYEAGNEPQTVADIEKMAIADPDHDWRIVKEGPMHGESFQRHDTDMWVCVKSNPGFA